MLKIKKFLKPKKCSLLKKSIPILLLIIISSLLTSCQDDNAMQEPESPMFECEENIDITTLSEDEKALEDLLWAETLKYLKGFLELLEKSSANCNELEKAITQTFDSDLNVEKRECLADKEDVQKMITHIKAVLKYPDQARRCFDSQRNYDVFSLYTPNESMKTNGEVTNWVDRPTLSDYFKDFPNEIGQAGIELSNAFQTILSKSETPSTISEDITYNNLPNLWSAVGWIPFYAENESAINSRFRGGYAYAEVMGPWGLLRIKSINGETVGSEIGMTMQLGDTYYPYHYHDPQEIYINLTPEVCKDENQFMVMDWNSEEFTQKSNTDGSVEVEVSAPNGNWKKWFKGHSSVNDWLTYFHRHAIHSFYVNKDCYDPNDPSGLVTMWARTTSRTFNQSTRICKPVAVSNGSPVGPADLFTCPIETIIEN